MHDDVHCLRYSTFDITEVKPTIYQVAKTFLASQVTHCLWYSPLVQNKPILSNCVPDTSELANVVLPCLKMLQSPPPPLSFCSCMRYDGSAGYSYIWGLCSSTSESLCWGKFMGSEFPWKLGLLSRCCMLSIYTSVWKWIFCEYPTTCISDI